MDEPAEMKHELHTREEARMEQTPYKDPRVVSPVTKSALYVADGSSLVDDEGNRFPVVNGIPRFVSSDNYAASFGKQWNTFQKTQIDKYNNSSISRDRFYRSSLWSPTEMAGQVVLEVGSGAGRFTQIALDSGATVYSFDYSNAVDSNLRNNGPNPKLHLFQASVYELPFRPASFDKIFCFGVLQHTPDVRASFMSMIPLLKPGGEIAVDVYALKWHTYLWLKYWYRPLTKRMKQDVLMAVLRRIVPLWFPVSSLIQRIPKVGWLMSQIIPVANYSTRFPKLSKAELIEWAIMDTFDMLSPEFDQPQTLTTLKRWFEEADLHIIYCGPGDNGFVGVGKKKA